MGSEWIKCTLAGDGTATYVNLAGAISMVRGASTSIVLAGGASLDVNETPEEILKQLVELKRADNWRG